MCVILSSSRSLLLLNRSLLLLNNADLFRAILLRCVSSSLVGCRFSSDLREERFRVSSTVCVILSSSRSLLLLNGSLLLVHGLGTVGGYGVCHPL